MTRGPGHHSEFIIIIIIINIILHSSANGQKSRNKNKL